MLHRCSSVFTSILLHQRRGARGYHTQNTRSRTPLLARSCKFYLLFYRLNAFCRVLYLFSTHTYGKIYLPTCIIESTCLLHINCRFKGDVLCLRALKRDKRFLSLHYFIRVVANSLKALCERTIEASLTATNSRQKS